MTTLTCRNDARRDAVRQSQKLAGMDYLEVTEDHLTLRVYFLGELPAAPLTPANFRIDGGRRVRDIRVVNVFAKQFHDADLDDYVEIVVDRFGDFSTYTLLVAGRIDFDPRYDRLDFTFTADCPAELDCPQPEACPPPQRNRSAINYLAKDYASFRQLIFDRLAVTLPDWKNRYVPDLGVTLVELLAYAGDYLSYYQDAVATEAYLDTSRQRVSVRRHARLVDYALDEGSNARALVVVGTTDELLIEPGKVRFITSPEPYLKPELTEAANGYLVFEAVAPTQLHAGHERIEIYTWGDSECCLPRGATSATLLGKWKLAKGDYLIFEEVLGPKTGLEADADRSHRWAVRLTSVLTDTDPLTGTDILNIDWAKKDALPFPLCLSSIGPAPQCELLSNVSIARGNVVVVDHGESVEEDLPAVEEIESTPTCEGEGLPTEVTRTAAPFRPRLSRPNLTFRDNVPIVSLSGNWTPTSDLIESRATDKHFVVEMDNDRIAWLRFGDGTHGALPRAGVKFHALYRVGTGTAGNVGAEAIGHALWPTQISTVIISVRNPLPAGGGRQPQSIEEIKLFAPHTFRQRLERAITAGDYAAIAQREFPLEVQRAAAALRWNGSWYEALVAIDAFGTAQASKDLLHRVKHRLEGYRRMGHDLRVEAAIRVPVLIVLQVCVKAVYLRAHVLADLQSRFAEYFKPDNLTFGGALYLSQVVSTAQSVSGVESVQVVTFERMFEGPHGEIDAGLIGFGPFEIALCDSDPSFPENGRIQFQIGGGR